jgi:glycosyltransferase involved in cell wall biosynthesis
MSIDSRLDHATKPLDLSLFTNLSGLREIGSERLVLRVTPFSTTPKSLSGNLRLYLELAKHDYALINCSPTQLFHVVLLNMLNPFSRCRVVSLDTVLPVPRLKSWSDRLAHRIKVRLFRGVHLFIEYFKDTRGYEHHYGMPPHKFRYVPFKINRYEKVLATPVSDRGYIFCGGNTRRDFATLFEAVRDTPYPVRIVTMSEHIIRGHGSHLEESNVPSNVEIVRHDGSESFVDHIAAARLVVLPIKKENISASGIGVYLAAMGLGKCVVISNGPAVDGVVPEGAAVVVPPEDPHALRAAIKRAYEDAEFRQRVAETGKDYARSLKGERRLYESVLGVLTDDFLGTRSPPAIMGQT